MVHFQGLLRAAVLAGLTGASLMAGAAQIVVGQVAPLSGLDGTQARAYSAGIQLALNKSNKAGGVHGHTFTLVRKDDGGRPDDNIAATRALLAENKPLVLAGYFGDRIMAGLQGSKLLETENVPLVGYRINEIRTEPPLVYSVRANLRDELNKITEHLVTVGVTRFGLFYSDGEGSAPLLATMEDVMKARGAKLTAKGTYALGTNRVPNAVVDTFLNAEPQAIVIVASAAASAAFIEKYRLDGGTAQLFTHSGVDIEQISQRLGEEQLKGVAIAQVTPNPYKVSGRLTKEFTDLVAATPDLEAPVSYAMMEGYIAGSVIVEAARRMGPKISREGFIGALNTVDLDLGGYKVGFKPGMRSGSRFVELTIVTASGRIRQ
jgi:branched-chain amino acid transport system substrate-binding protein